MTSPDPKDPRLTVMFDGAPMESRTPLIYPFADRLPGGIPEMGRPFEVADGIFWFRTPLPFALNHINLWLLEDGDGWTVLDTGYRSTEVEAYWQSVFSGLFGGKPIRRPDPFRHVPCAVSQLLLCRSQEAARAFRQLHRIHAV